MRTAEECTAMAIELERKATGCANTQTRLDFDQMAKTWRWLAIQAAWQDRFTAQQLEWG